MNILNQTTINFKSLWLPSAVSAAIFWWGFAFASGDFKALDQSGTRADSFPSPNSSPLPSQATESINDVHYSSDKGDFKRVSVGVSALAMSPIYYNTETVMGVLFSVGYDLNHDMGFRGFAADTSGRSSFWFGGLDFEFTPLQLSRVGGSQCLVDLGGLIGGTIGDTLNNNYNAFAAYIGPRINVNFSNTLQLAMSYRFTIYNTFEGGFNYRF